MELRGTLILFGIFPNDRAIDLPIFWLPAIVYDRHGTNERRVLLLTVIKHISANGGKLNSCSQTDTVD